MKINSPTTTSYTALLHYTRLSAAVWPQTHCFRSVGKRKWYFCDDSVFRWRLKPSTGHAANVANLRDGSALAPIPEVEIWRKLREWTFWPPLSIRPPIHHGVYLHSLCPFVDETFNITPLYRRSDLAIFAQSRNVFMVFAAFSYANSTNFRLIDFSSFFLMYKCTEPSFTSRRTLLPESLSSGAICPQISDLPQPNVFFVIF